MAKILLGGRGTPKTDSEKVHDALQRKKEFIVTCFSQKCVHQTKPTSSLIHHLARLMDLGGE